MNYRSQRLLQEIETGALDQQTPIGDLLRKVIALGGEAKSAEVRDWALSELNGYGPEDELPPYRTFTAPLQIDWMNRAHWVRGETISSLDLPDFARDVITDQVDFPHPITQIEELARRCKPGEVVKLAPPGSQDLVTLMNAKRKDAQIDRLYWGVSPVALWGVVDRVRTTLTAMTAEIRAEMPDNSEAVPAPVAGNALHFAVTGERNKITFTAPQGANEVATTPEEPRPWWRTASAVIAGVIGLLVAMAGGLFALMQAQGWQF